MDRKRFWLLLPIFVLSLPLFLASCNLDPNQRKLSFLAQGDRAFQQNKYAEAVIDYGRAVQISLRDSAIAPRCRAASSNPRFW